MYIYTDEDEDFIIKNYSKMTRKQLANHFNVSLKAITHKINHLGLRKIKPRTPNVWNDEEIQFLKDNVNILSRSELAKRLGKTTNNVRNKIIDLKLIPKGQKKGYVNQKGFCPKLKWTKEDIDWFVENYNKIQQKEIAKHFNCSVVTIRRRAKMLGLVKERVITENSFNYYELEILKFYYNQIPKRELLKLLPNKTWQQIHRRALKMNLAEKKHSAPEEIVETFLKKYNYNFVFQKKISNDEKYYLIDFVVENKIAIEVQGDYWHGNPAIYNEKNLNELQRNMRQRDIEKKELMETKYNYKVVYLWENDLIYNRNVCEQTIKEMLQR